MDIRRATLVSVLLLVPVSASADRHFADMMAAYGHGSGSDYNGYQLAVSFPLPKWDVSLVGSFGRFWGKESDDNADHTLTTFVIGGRFTGRWKIGSIAKKKDGKNVDDLLLPFGQVLFGRVDNVRKLDDQGLSQVARHWVLLVGGGIQPRVPFSDNERLRVRFQVDYLYRSHEVLGGTEPGGSGVVFLVGLMYRFGPEFPHDSHSHSSPPKPPADRRGPPEPGEQVGPATSSSLR